MPSCTITRVTRCALPILSTAAAPCLKTSIAHRRTPKPSVSTVALDPVCCHASKLLHLCLLSRFAPDKYMCHELKPVAPRASPRPILNVLPQIIFHRHVKPQIPSRYHSCSDPVMSIFGERSSPSPTAAGSRCHWIGTRWKAPNSLAFDAVEHGVELEGLDWAQREGIGGSGGVRGGEDAPGRPDGRNDDWSEKFGRSPNYQGYISPRC